MISGFGKAGFILYFLFGLIFIWADICRQQVGGHVYGCQKRKKYDTYIAKKS